MATFNELFVGGGQAHGRWHPEKGASTLKGPASDQDYAEHLNGVVGLGLVPVREDGTCRFAAVDIDIDTIDHAQLYQRVTARRMPLAVCRSKSGGAHLYLFMREPGMPAGQVIAILKRWAALLGYPKVEIFPKQAKVGAKNLGNWINLPYFGSDRTTRYAVGQSGALSLESFLASVVYYDAVVATQVDEASTDNQGMPPCLRALSELGLPEGSRNQGLFNFAVFFRKSNPKGWEEQLTKHNEALAQPLDYREVQAIIASVSRTKYQYLCEQEPIKSHCDRGPCMKLPFGVGHMPWDEKDNYDEFKASHCRKLLTDPPRYVVEVNGHDLELASEEFLSYSTFRRRVMELLDLVIPPMKQPSWETQVRELLKAKTDIDAPPEASVTGQVVERLMDFISLRSRATDDEDLFRGLPIKKGGWVIFRASDLKKYLANARLDRVDLAWLYQTLRLQGCVHGRIRLLNKVVNIWKYPLDETPEQAEFTVRDFGPPEEL